MKQVFKINTGFRTGDVPIPTPDNKEILVKVNYSLISTGTETGSLRNKTDEGIYEKIKRQKELIAKIKSRLEKEGFSATIEKIRKKLAPGEDDMLFRPVGYSNAGVVLETGRLVKDFKPGDRVACAGSGIAAHAEYVTVPVNLAVRIPDNLQFEKACFTTVASIALQGIRRSECSPGETIVVYGLGLLGLIAVQIAKNYGYRVIGIDIVPERVELARDLGADEMLLSSGNIKEKIFSATGGNGADSVIIYASSPGSEIINSAINFCRRKGRVVIVGAVGMDIKREEMYRKELDIVMSTSYGPGRYDDNYEFKGNDYPFGYVRWTENRNMQEVVRLLAEDKINTSRLVNEIFEVTEAEKAFNSLIDKEKRYISVLFRYDEPDKPYKENKVYTFSHKRLQNEKINVSLIGAGGFATRTHLPNILKLPGLYNLRAIADKDPLTAKRTGEKMLAEYSTTDYHDILEDDETDMIIIATRHNLHGRIVTEALKKNKHILVEKPLAITMEELEEIKATLKDSTSLIRVGFNRRYSPLISRIKEILAADGNPACIIYRINAGSLPDAHWTLDPEIGGGRIIGEFCHFIDLANYIISSPVISLDAVQIPVDNRSVFYSDNLCVNIGYKNGSVAQISYITIGAKDLAKERLEVHTGKKSMIINDFTNLELFNTGLKGIKLAKPDKGHLKELELFAAQLKGENNVLPPFESDIETTELTFKIIEMLKMGNSVL